MTENAVHQNPYNAALVATQESYLGEILGKFLDAEAKLRVASLRIQELNERLTLQDQQAEQLKEAQKDQVTKIKLEEVLKFINPIKENQSVKDEIITGILQYFDLIDELKRGQ